MNLKMSSRGAKKPAHVDYVCLSAMYNESTYYLIFSIFWDIQGLAIRPVPGFVNAAGRATQKW